MDIRRWLTTPKGAPVNAIPENTKQASKQVKPSKKRRIESDSESDTSPKKKIPLVKKGAHLNNGGSPVSSSRDKLKNKRSKRVIDSSSDEEIVVESDTGTPAKKASAVKKLKVRPNIVQETPKALKAKSVSDFFSSAPIQRSSTKRESSKKALNTSIERNHEDEDFCKTLAQLENSPKKEIEDPVKKGTKADCVIKEKSSVSAETKKGRGKTSSTTSGKQVETKTSSKEKQSKSETVKAHEKTRSPKKNIKRFSSDIEIIPPTPPPAKVEEKSKKVIEETPPESKKKGNYVKYLSYMEREGPRSLGSKEIPEGEEGCLEGMTFIITGVLESIERDDAKALIEKHGGKVMSTLTKNTKFVVIGRDAGSGKMEKAEKFGTKQLDEDGLFDLIRNTRGRGPKKKVVAAKEKESPASTINAQSNRFQHFALGGSTSKVPVEEPKAPVEKPLKVSFEETKCENKPSVSKQVESSPTVQKSDVRASSLEMWVDKYKPTALKQIIGQQGDKSNAKKLFYWLCSYRKSTKNRKPAVAGNWNMQGDGSGFKAALLSGPPGVGKTTTAQLVCKEAKFDYIEFNASDTRSKKSLQNVISQVLLNQSLAGFFKGSSANGISSNHVIIMDEVDGMAGNEDRGGIQELISFIKLSKIPIICICNDRNHPKIRSLSNYCFDLRFQRPRVEQIKAAMLSICFKEGIKVAPNVLQDIIVASNHDVRQVLHNLSLWCSKEKGLSAEQAKEDIGFGTKHIKMGPFDVLREVFAMGHNKKATINDKAALFFHDYSIAPLFVQENYVHVLPSAAGGNQINHLQLLSEAADSICIGDLIDKQIRSNSSWSLLPTQAIFASVLPGELLTGHLKQMINFPAWLGKNSNRNHMDRILQELQMHMRMRITGNKTEVSMEYLPLLKHALTKPLLEKEVDGVRDALKVMDYYSLLREDFDSIIELSLWSQQTDPRSKISTKVKSAFTRAYNKECGQNPYAVTSVSKKKRGSDKGDESLLTEEGAEEYISEAEEEEEDNSIENDAMIKVKKQPKKAESSEPKASTSKKTEKTTSKRGRSKK